MSRDFTPLERCISNKQSGFDSWLQNIVMQYGEKEWMLFTDEQQKIRHEYKNLAVSMSDSFLELYDRLPEGNRKAKLNELEQMISELFDACQKGKTAFMMLNVPETVKKWFIGKLDPYFYYAETNDKLFLDWCLKEKGEEQ